MQDADLFMELAAIAGVFVGFGALIAVRSGGASDAFEVAPMRRVVSSGCRPSSRPSPRWSSPLRPRRPRDPGAEQHPVSRRFIGVFAINNLTPEARVADDPIPTSIKVVGSRSGRPP